MDKFPLLTEEERRRIRSVLVIKLRYIGDMVLTTPLLAALRCGLPNAKIDVLLNGNTAAILEGQSVLDSLIPVDGEKMKQNPAHAVRMLHRIRRSGYELVIDLTGNDRSALFTRISGARLRMGYPARPSLTSRLRRCLAYTCLAGDSPEWGHIVDHHLKPARRLGLPVGEPHPRLAVSPARRREIAGLLADAGLGERPYIIIHPGARRWYKSWPPERFAELIRRIHESGMTGKNGLVRPVLSGGKEDRAVCAKIARETEIRLTGSEPAPENASGEPVINLSGRIPLSLLPALIQGAEALIGNDSAPIHIATAVKTPVLSLFGPTRNEDWAPRRRRDRVLRVALPCRPCGHGRKDCPLGASYCLGRLSADTAWNALTDMMGHH